MQTNVKPMGCGNCGGKLFRMFFEEGKRDQALLAECEKCKSVSIITVEMPTLKIDWGEGAEGILSQAPA